MAAKFHRGPGVGPDQVPQQQMAGAGELRLDRDHAASMPAWLEGSAKYLKAIRSDARYRKLKVSELVKP